MPPIRYVQSFDGQSIGYAMAGDGPPLLSLPRLAIELGSQSPIGRRVLDRFQQFATYIRMDYRVPGPETALEDYARDIEAVLDDAGVSRLALYGGLTGAPLAIHFAATRPERITRLILFNAVSRVSQATFSRERNVTPLMDSDWELFTDVWALVRFGWEQAEAAQGYAAWLRDVSDPERFKVWLEQAGKFDASALLPQLQVPTLILHRRGNPTVPVAVAQELAAAIPDAELVLLDGEETALFAGDFEAAAEWVERFVGRDASSAEGQPLPGFQTILFTDLESSTALTQRLGDEGAQELLRGHNDAVRGALEAHSGREVKHTGDGIMASFPSAVSAVQAALAMQRDLAGAEVRVRIGLNAGEPIAEDDDLFGTAVQLAARITDRAEPGQVLVSRVVADLCAGKGFEFRSVGDATLKGFDEPVALYEVRAG